MTTHYEYADPEGVIIYRVAVDRTNPHEKKVFQQRACDDGFINGMEGVDPLPYRLPELLKAVRERKRVFIVEGEKDVERLFALGLIATTNTGGAGKWRDEYAEYLEGADVVIIGDVDEAGQAHVRKTVDSLRTNGRLQTLKVVDLTSLGVPLPDNGDVSDYFDAGGSLDALLTAADRAPDILVDALQRLEYPKLDLDRLPPLFRNVVRTVDSPQDQLTVALSSIVSLGACMTNVYMVVSGRPLNPMLYVMIVGNAATGKSIAQIGRDLVSGVDAKRRERYNQEMKEYTAKQSTMKSGVNPVADPPPPYQSLFVPGNSTNPVLLNALHDNLSSLLHETEADSLAALFNAKYGDSTAAMRQAYSHEQVSFRRVRHSQPLLIDRPMLAVVVAGTPSQVSSMFRSVEDGFLSRFLFHIISHRSEYRSPFRMDEWRVNSIGPELASRVRDFYESQILDSPRRIGVTFTPRMQDELDCWLQARDALIEQECDPMKATVRRLATVVARIATILTVSRLIRIDDDATPETIPRGTDEIRLEVNDDDFATALRIGQYALDTASRIISSLPAVHAPNYSSVKESTLAWYNALPDSVTRKEAIELGAVYSISQRTVDRRLKDNLLFHQIEHGRYEKVSRGSMAT
jgi:hypothetical protein